MRNAVLVIVALLVLMGIWFWLKGEALPGDGTETATTTEEETAGGQRDIGTPNSNGAVAEGEVPSQNPQTINEVNAALRSTGSVRCEWIDEDSGADGLAFIKNGSVRVETKPLDGEQQIILHNSVGTYIWEPNADTGLVIKAALKPDQQIARFGVRSELENYIRTNERVHCASHNMSDEQFQVPADVTFSEPE